MSGIYIPGMEMPTGNDVLTIAIDSDGRLYSIYFSDGKLGINSLHKNVIPVPEHDGPLVDALDIINAFPDEFIFTNEQARALTNYIIPADKEGKE